MPSILGRRGPASARPSPAVAKRDRPEDLEQLGKFGREVGRLTDDLRAREADVAKLASELKEALAKLDAANEREIAMRSDLDGARGRLSQVETDREEARAEASRLATEHAAERAANAALREQLATDGQRSSSETLIRVERMAAGFEQALLGLPEQFQKTVSAGVAAALASRPTPEPPEYEMQVTGRDINNRLTTIRLRPAKE